MKDWRDGDRDLSARISVLERRSETAAIRALRRMLWRDVADDAACSCDDGGGPCVLCEAWAALGHAGKWPGAVKAARKMERS